MDYWITVDLAGRRLEDFAFEALCETQDVDRTMDRGLGGLHRIVLVMNRGCRAGEIVNLICLNIERKRYIVADEFKVAVVEQMLNVPLRSREEIVEAEDLRPLRQQSLAEMRTQESCSARDEHRFRHASPAFLGRTEAVAKSQIAGSSGNVLRRRW